MNGTYDSFGRNMSLVSGANLAPSKNEIGISTNGSSSYGLISLPLKQYSELTLVAVTVPAALTTSDTVVGLGNSSDSNPIFRITTGNSDASKVRFWLRGDNSGTLTFTGDSTNTAFVVGKRSVVSFYARGSDGPCYCYIDGIKDTVTTTIATTFTVDRLAIGTLHFGGTAADFYSGNTSLALMFNRELKDWEHKKLAENPWQIFEPETIPLFYSAGGGGSATNLSIFDALHSHNGDNLTFSLSTYLAAQDSVHVHSADNLTLDTSTEISLSLSDSLHGLSSDVITLITGSYLQVADALHGHSADVLTLATASFLAVADALHAHAADNLTLDTSNATPLTTQDATHVHSADNSVLTLDTWLAIVKTVHAHSADNVSISATELLAIADALHTLVSDALVLSIPSPPGTCPSVTEIVAAIFAAAQITPIHADIRKVNSVTVDGTGTPGDTWGPV